MITGNYRRLEIDDEKFVDTDRTKQREKTRTGKDHGTEGTRTGNGQEQEEKDEQ